MEIKPSLANKLAKLYGTIQKIPKRFADAIKEQEFENVQLNCVQQGVLYFDLIEEDINKIYTKLLAENYKILGSHLVLDGANDFMEIKIYLDRDSKAFARTLRASVKIIANVPDIVKEELEKNGIVELNLKI
jgi:hypothetical protein